MIRRAPTSISLSNRDVVEHFENIERKKPQDRENVQSKQGRDTLSTSPAYELTYSLAEQLEKKDEPDVTLCKHREVNQRRAPRGEAPSCPQPRETGEQGSLEEIATCDIDHGGLKLREPRPMDRCNDFETEVNPDIVDPADSLGRLTEPPVIRHEDHSQRSSQISRNTFDYGGFMDINAEQSSSFIPQDVSTPRNNETHQRHTPRSTHPLAGSPLFRDQGTKSPERRLTSSVAPRVASYGTPSLLLSQPPRRPRSYRPRTISYSFEESERASTGYDQFQGSDNDSNGDHLPNEARSSPPDELGAASSPSASSDSNVPSSPPELAETSLSRRSKATPAAEEIQRVHSSSPQLPLPPPFSAVRRNVSLTASLPSAHGHVGRFRSPTPIHDIPRLQAGPVAGSSASSHEEGSSPGSSNVIRDLASLPLRLLSVYRSRSPFQTRFDRASSGRVSPLPQQSQSRGPEGAPSTSTRHQFQIYDDSMPATSQPQTPQHLPEARHQSRFHPSYTAPARGRIESPRAHRWRGTRSDSPPGMETPGFLGLYGGQENQDDEVMFDGASRRLWALSSARRHGRSLSNTPDGEASFVDSLGGIR